MKLYTISIDIEKEFEVDEYIYDIENEEEMYQDEVGLESSPSYYVHAETLVSMQHARTLARGHMEEMKHNLNKAISSLDTYVWNEKPKQRTELVT